MKKYKLIKQLPKPFDKIFDVGCEFDNNEISWDDEEHILLISYEDGTTIAELSIGIHGPAKFGDYFENQKPKSVWDLQAGDIYWMVCSIDWGIADKHWVGSNDELLKRLGGNCFLTKEEAENQLGKCRAVTRIQKYIHDNDMEFEPDWGDDTQWKYYIYYNCNFDRLDYDRTTYRQYLGEVFFFKTEIESEKVIKDCRHELLVVLGLANVKRDGD